MHEVTTPLGMRSHSIVRCFEGQETQRHITLLAPIEDQLRIWGRVPKPPPSSQPFNTPREDCLQHNIGILARKF